MTDKHVGETMDSLRDRLVLAALDHVPFDGWSMKTLRHAAKDCGVDSYAPDRAFPNGVTSAVDHFTRLADRLMVEDLAQHNVMALPIHERIALAVRVRLERWALHQEAVRRALSVFALPQNVGLAAQSTGRTVDAIWKAIGDRSADFNWYTKRATLAAVYSATVLYWLDDRSQGFVATWDFLDRRIMDTVRLIKARKSVTDRMMKTLRNPFAFLPGQKIRRPGRRA